MLLTLTMLPWPLAAIPGANAATRKNGARTLLANILSNAETSNSAVGPKRAMPDVAPVTSARCPARLFRLMVDIAAPSWEAMTVVIGCTTVADAMTVVIGKRYDGAMQAKNERRRSPARARMVRSAATLMRERGIHGVGLREIVTHSGGP